MTNAMKTNATRVLAFVGSIDRASPYFSGPRGQGISVLAFDPASGALTLLSQTAGADNPTFVAIGAAGPTLYATSEVWGWHEGVVTAYRIDAATGHLSYINKQPTRGSITAQASLHPDGHWLLVANYRMGEDGLRPPQAAVVLPIEADGGLGPVADSVAHHGTGPDAARQDGPHPHCAVPSPDGRHVLVADLGTDDIVVYRFDAERGRLTLAGAHAMPPGTGPRHLVFTPSGRHIVVTGELNNTVTALAWQDGHLRPVSTVSTLPAGWQGESHAADIQVAPDGRFVYAANRGHDSIAVLALDAAGTLTAVAHQPTRRAPRSFALDPSGGCVLVAAQDDHDLSVFRRDAATGALSGPVARLDIGSPLCIRLAAFPAA
jgi:6-phosphogluconolactonase